MPELSANISDQTIPSTSFLPLCNTEDTVMVALSGHKELELMKKSHEYSKMSKELKVWIR